MVIGPLAAVVETDDDDDILHWWSWMEKRWRLVMIMNHGPNREMMRY
jgi:hypothetical protein